MERAFYKSLDREFEFLGVKGSWVKIFLLIAGGAVLLGVALGFVFGTGVALAFIAGCVAFDFFICLTTQSKVPSRQVSRARLSGGVGCWVVRRETLSRVLCEDPRYEELQRHRKAQSASGAGNAG